MKKTFLVVLATAFLGFNASAQIMANNGFRNTVWTAFGNAWDSANSGNEKDMLDSANWGYLGNDKDTRWTGVTDTFQAKLAAGALDIDLMLQWGALSTYTDDELDYAKIKYMDSDVNFTFNATQNLDLAMGTYLNWRVGPAPAHGANSWEIAYHLKQGGLSYGNPGQGLVAGATYYANYINQSIDLTESHSGLLEPITEALAARYNIADVLTVSAAIPSGSTTDDFIANIGGTFTPTNTILIAASYNGIFRSNSNFYAGMTIGVDAISIDGWLGMNNLGGKKDDQITGIGGAINFALNNWKLRPEAGFTFYENDDYSIAMYAGMSGSYEIKNNINLNIWGSFAFGSDDDNNTVKKGGHIFDVRPDVTFYINSTDALAASYEYQMITTCRDNSYNFWNIGLFWSHAF